MKYTEILEQLINEVNMSPSILRKLAANIDARAGMEFEMIVPEIGDMDGSDYFESEPDYDQDESIGDFDDIRRFFHDGEHNGRRAVERLMDEIEQAYYDSDFLSEKKQEEWADASYDIIKELVDRDYSDELFDRAVEEIEKSNSEFGVGTEEFRNMVEQRHAEMIKEKVDEILADMGSDYDEAYDEWENNDWQNIMSDTDTQSEWLEFEGHTAMSDISRNYDIEWPYWTEYDGSGDGEENAQRIADDFSNHMGKRVNFSTSYHGARREPNAYVVEPDGSLEGDEPGDAGLEFVSPPMPINELLADLASVKEWADKNRCYTNDSTGLHINVSVPDFSMEKLDYVKLAVLLGDERVLNEFGRMGNTYAKSALQIVKQNIKQRPEDAAALLNKMKEHLSTAAAKVIHSGTTNKFTSINTKSGYIEFRSPGGDWLNANFSIIEPTLLRFVVALDAALDETKYKQEYAKKLYKLLAPSSNEPGIVELFANFSAGELDKEALIRQVRAAQLSRDIAKGKTGPGKKYWWNVEWSNGRRMEVVAPNEKVAKEVAAEEWGVHPESEAALSFKASVLRPYEETPVKATTGEPQAVGRSGGPTVGGRASNPEGAWILAPRGENPPVPVYRFNASGVDDANTVLAQWQQEHPGDAVDVHYDPQATRGQPPIPGSTLDLQRQRAAQAATGNSQRSVNTPPASGEGMSGNWGLWLTNAERFAKWGGTEDLRRFTTRAAAEQYLADLRQSNPMVRGDIEVREIEPAQADQFQEPNANRGNLTPHGPGPWEIYRISDGSSVRHLDHTNRMAAEQEARTALGLRAEAPELYGVRTRQQADTAPARTATVPGQAQQRFTGHWDVKIGDEVVFRVQAETQGEANQKARAWILQRSPEFIRQHEGGEVTVTPRYE
jgi:Putative amidoligase enzyme